jgi:hypothetical protein
MRREDLPKIRLLSSYVLRDAKLAYVVNPKAACTSIKWILSDLAGFPPERFTETIRPASTRYQAIHQNRGKWTGVPSLSQLDDAELAEITPDNGWFVFSATRHPATRVFSAWQNKLLVREPSYTGHHKEPWYPRIPRTTQDVLDDFFTFVDHLADPGMAMREDMHFRLQSELLHVPGMPYDRVYDTKEFPQFLDDLRAHLARVGFTREFSVRRTNETPLPPLAAAFPPPVLEVIERVYDSDYDAFGYPRGVPPGARPEPEWPRELVATVGMLVDRHERIGDLRRKAVAEQKRADKLAGAQRKANQVDRGSVKGTLARVRRKLRPAR